jgi:hypothetical protein
MLLRLRFLLFVPLFILSGIAVHAQDNDYLKHGKVFCLCSFHLDCSYCKDCNNERYAVKINNNLDKKITRVFYTYYSEPYNQIFEKEGKMETDEIQGRQTGIVHICVPNGLNWIISKIVYADGSTNAFTLHERMENFHQDPDECDCND